MEGIVPFLALIGVAGGWMLAEASKWFQLRRDFQRAVGQALAVLLEVRHYLLAIKHVQDFLRDQLSATQEVGIMVGFLAPKFLPFPEKLHERYEEVLSLIAGSDPVMAFRLRCQDLPPRLIDELRGMMLGDEKARSAWPEFESLLLRQVIPGLEEHIHGLAKSHGFRTRRHVRERLARPIELPTEEFQALLRKISPQTKQEAQGDQKG